MVKTLANCIRDIIKISVENKVEGIKIFFSAPNPRHPDSDTLNLKDKKSVEANFQWIAYQILFRKNDKYYIYNTVLEPNGLEKNPPSDKVFESDSNWSGKNKSNPVMDFDIGEIRRNNPGILKGPNLFPEKYGQTIYTNYSSDDRGKSYSSEEFEKLFNNDFYIVLNPKKKELKNPFGEDIGIKYPGKEEVKNSKAVVQAAKEKKKPARGFDIMQDLIKNPVPIKRKSSEKPEVEVLISHDNLSYSNILWKDKKLIPSRESVEAFKKKGYYYRPFPEGDGAAFSASHKSDEKIRQDIRECFSFEIKGHK